MCVIKQTIKPHDQATHIIIYYKRYFNPFDPKALFRSSLTIEFFLQKSMPLRPRTFFNLLKIIYCGSRTLSDTLQRSINAEKYRREYALSIDANDILIVKGINTLVDKE